jgi:hypothetical protein
MTEETPTARRDRCLDMARQLRLQAERAGDPELAAGYLELAAIWLQLAEDACSPAPANDFPEVDLPESRTWARDGDEQREA